MRRQKKNILLPFCHKDVTKTLVSYRLASLGSAFYRPHVQVGSMNIKCEICGHYIDTEQGEKVYEVDEMKVCEDCNWIFSLGMEGTE